MRDQNVGWFKITMNESRHFQCRVLHAMRKWGEKTQRLNPTPLDARLSWTTSELASCLSPLPTPAHPRTHPHPNSQRFVTVPEVLQEIRDKHARRVLDNLPFELELRTPSNDAMIAVRAFAEKTGDLRGLSLPDLRVLALAYMMEKEINGIKHLRTEPKKMGPRSQVPCTFFEQGRCRAGDTCPFLHAPPKAPRGQGPGATVNTVYGPGEVVEWRHGGIVVVEFAFGQGYLSSTTIRVPSRPSAWGGAGGRAGKASGAGRTGPRKDRHCTDGACTVGGGDGAARNGTARSERRRLPACLPACLPAAVEEEQRHNKGGKAEPAWVTENRTGQQGKGHNNRGWLACAWGKGRVGFGDGSEGLFLLF